jgi:hypothetical protein
MTIMIMECRQAIGYPMLVPCFDPPAICQVSDVVLAKA